MPSACRWCGDGLTIEGPNTTEGWRPTTVEVMVMFPAWYFDWYGDENTVTVEVYEVALLRSSIPARPTGAQGRPVVVGLRLPANADWSGDDRDQIAAWMTFDFSDQIAAGAFYWLGPVCGGGWDSMASPTWGTRTELSCAQLDRLWRKLAAEHGVGLLVADDADLVRANRVGRLR